MYKIIAIMGKAGSGKDSIMQEVLKLKPDLHEIVSCTTRPIRDNEINGINYIFMTGEQFGEKVLNGEMLEATCFNDWFYGTSFDSLRSDCVNIGVFNPTGVYSLIENPNVDTDIWYIQTDDKTRLLRQLNREEHPDVHEIIRRFSTDEKDFSELDDIPYMVLINNTPGDLIQNARFIVDNINLSV